MKLYGIFLSKNEGDILRETLEHLRALACFEKIFFYDTGSSDDTFEIACEFPDLIERPQKTDVPFSDQLRFDLLYRHKDLFAEGDWFAIIDSDEFYTQNPLPLIAQAESEQATCIEAKFAQFYITDLDVDTPYQDQKSVQEQRLYYLINWGEIRLLKYLPDSFYDDVVMKKRLPPIKIASKKMLMTHFQFRSPQQIQRRINTRLENNKTSHNWGHVSSSSWQDYVVPHALLHRFDGQFKYGLPENLNLYRVKNNRAYSMASIKWIFKSGDLQKQYHAFLEDQGISRLLNKLLSYLRLK
jgi:glycosyltransferase involved in cell wall biosynthesis